jgi:hypothetical protein
MPPKPQRKDPYAPKRGAVPPTLWYGTDAHGADPPIRLAGVRGRADEVAFDTIIGSWSVSGVVRMNREHGPQLRSLDMRPFTTLDYLQEEGVAAEFVGTREDASIDRAALRSIRPDEVVRRVLGVIRVERGLLRAADEHAATGSGKGTWNLIGTALPLVKDAGTSRVIVAAGKQRGRPSKGEAFYEQIARAWIELHEHGHGRAAAKLLAAEYERRTGQSVTPATVRSWVKRARDRGFLAPTTSGSPRALPGPRLLDLDA